MAFQNFFQNVFLNKQDYRLKLIHENIETIIYSMVCFFAPFFIGHPQIVVGVLVNASLVMAALNVRTYRILPVIIFPSLGVLSRGLIFGPFTIFLIYMIPFIWISNFIQVYAIKKLNLSLKLNRWLSLGIGIAVKSGFLFTIALLLVNMNILPAIFLTTMGLFQIYTAIIGGVIAISAHEVKKKFFVIYKVQNFINSRKFIL